MGSVRWFRASSYMFRGHADSARARAAYLAAACALILEVLALMDAEPDADALLRAGARPAQGQVFCKVQICEGVACKAMDARCVVWHHIIVLNIRQSSPLVAGRPEAAKQRRQQVVRGKATCKCKPDVDGSDIFLSLRAQRRRRPRATRRARRCPGAGSMLRTRTGASRGAAAAAGASARSAATTAPAS